MPDQLKAVNTYMLPPPQTLQAPDLNLFLQSGQQLSGLGSLDVASKAGSAQLPPAGMCFAAQEDKSVDLGRSCSWTAPGVNEREGGCEAQPSQAPCQRLKARGARAMDPKEEL